MSWETLVAGCLRLKNATDKDLIKIRDHLEFGNECEKIDVKVEGGITVIDFQSVNWLSHLDEEKIEKMLKELKKKLVSYWITLYYLEGEFAKTWYKDEKV